MGIEVIIAQKIVEFSLLAAASWAIGELTKPDTPSATPASPAVQNALRPRDTFESAEAPEMRAVGRVRLGGLKAFGNTRGVNRYRLTLHCKGEIDGFEELYFAGREIVADTDNDGAVSSFPWAKPGGSWAFVRVKTGRDDEVAWEELKADFPELWTNDHRLRGVAQAQTSFVAPGVAGAEFLQRFGGAS